MSIKRRSRHTGQTKLGDTRQALIEKLGKVTIYQRGVVYYLYYREAGKSVRRKVDGNLAVARATAGKVVQSLAEDRASPFAFVPVSWWNATWITLSTSSDFRWALRTATKLRCGCL